MANETDKHRSLSLKAGQVATIVTRERVRELTPQEIASVVGGVAELLFIETQAAPKV